MPKPQQVQQIGLGSRQSICLPTRWRYKDLTQVAICCQLLSLSPVGPSDGFGWIFTCFFVLGALVLKMTPGIWGVTILRVYLLMLFMFFYQFLQVLKKRWVCWLLVFHFPSQWRHGSFWKHMSRHTWYPKQPGKLTSWWLNQPIWKICSSNRIIYPSTGENTTCLKPPPS